jgi:hypothetical protein
MFMIVQLPIMQYFCGVRSLLLEIIYAKTASIAVKQIPYPFKHKSLEHDAVHRHQG